MSYKKQTAVEWLNRWILDNTFAKFADYTEAVTKARAMEREQIEAAFQAEWTETNNCGKNYYE